MLINVEATDHLLNTSVLPTPWLMKLDWLQPGDIVVATYPKAGTTLMQQIIMLLLNGGDSDKVRVT